MGKEQEKTNVQERWPVEGWATAENRGRGACMGGGGCRISVDLTFDNPKKRPEKLNKKIKYQKKKGEKENMRVAARRGGILLTQI